MSFEEKIDFLERYLANYEKLEIENLNYFVGLSENAISLFNLYQNYDKKYVNHRRIYYGEKAVDFYNPLNIILDYHIRDIAEYSKSAFMSGNNQIIDNLKFLKYDEWMLYFARILYPSFYFDFVDEYINYGRKMDKKRIRALSNSFELTIRELYRIISININVPYIDWLANINNL